MSAEQDAVLTAPGAASTDVGCIHHWVIETPAGPVSLGTCKRCGEEREFRNYAEKAPYWEDDSSHERSLVPASIPGRGVGEDGTGQE